VHAGALPPTTPAASPAKPLIAAAPVVVEAISLPLEGTGFYIDRKKWAAINPDRHREAAVSFPAPMSNGRFRIKLHVVGESDGNSTFEVSVGDRSLGWITAAPSREMFEEGPAFAHTWRDVIINEGERITVRARIASSDGKEYSRGRWSKIEFSAIEADPGKESARLDLAAEQAAAAMARRVERKPDGDGAVTVTGELKQWHAVTLQLAGPFAAENDTAPNPFTDLRFDVTFTHESGAPRHTVPGYFAADGDAAQTSATAGNVWRAHLSPDKPGRWTYEVSFTRGPHVAMNGGGQPIAPYQGRRGEFTVGPTDKTGRDFRARGRLVYNGSHYLVAAGTGEPFIKAGADSPETLLAYQDFDDTIALKTNVPLKTWSPHFNDWRAGDPEWKNGRGRGLIGALNYLAGAGANAISFLTYNAAGDGDNVWPFMARDTKFHYDCSKLDQWGIVFAHAQARGLFLHFKLQENENDDDRIGSPRTPGLVPESLDGGATGPERRLYFRELIARYGHHLALNWNLGEENTQTAEEQRAMADFIRDTDPYDHLIVIHSFPQDQDRVYEALIGAQSVLTGVSAQNNWAAAHQQTLRWVRASAAAGRPWVVCNDEQNPASLGVPPDEGYRGYAHTNRSGHRVAYGVHDIRKSTLWGTLLAGGAGVEYYFGYSLPENDLLLEDFRSRAESWRFCGIAVEFFEREKLPLMAMRTLNELVTGGTADVTPYCFAAPGEIYLVYLPAGGEAVLDLSAAAGEFSLSWFNPRAGGASQPGAPLKGGAKGVLKAPSGDDWLAVIRRL
jgi:hypothetical protein